MSYLGFIVSNITHRYLYHDTPLFSFDNFICPLKCANENRFWRSAEVEATKTIFICAVRAFCSSPVPDS